MAMIWICPGCKETDTDPIIDTIWEPENEQLVIYMECEYCHSRLIGKINEDAFDILPPLDTSD